MGVWVDRWVVETVIGWRLHLLCVHSEFNLYIIPLLCSSGISKVEEEFQRLGRSAVPPSQFKAANLYCNKQKNRCANVLPYDDSRVKLSLIPGVEDSDYINANFIDGYMKNKAFIATQAPIPVTIPDFWNMIWQQSSLTIVMLSNEMESGHVS